MAKKENSNDLLKFGAAAGPLYISVGIIEMFLNPGFDIRKHSLSLLSIGHLGWIHIALFMFTGLFVLLGAIGVRKTIKGEKAGTWAPLLLGLYGIGLIAAGIFPPDPMKGFPPGMPEGVISTNGIMHLVAGMVGFIGLIAACFVFARRFFAMKEKGFATFSWVTGVIFFVSFFGIAGFSQQSDQIVKIVNLSFTFAVILSWVWLSNVMKRLMRK